MAGRRRARIGSSSATSRWGGFSKLRRTVDLPSAIWLLELSAGDQVTVEIVEDREGGLPRLVTAAGELDVFPVGRVKVSGKTVAEAAASIKQLLERDYYYHATVRLAIDRVNTAQVRSGIVYLSGEVKIVGPQEILSAEALTLSTHRD